MARVCGALDPTDPKSLVVPDPDPDEISAFVQAAPPMQGAELITAALLEDLWSDIGKALGAEATRFKDGVQGYLKKQSSVWNVVGRVCFHLAENKRDPEFPFAFIATYVHKVSKQAKPQHLPLGRALKDYAGAKNRQKLLALLSPLSRAAEQSEFIRELVDSGDIYHPLSWTPREAHRFLCEIALYEQAGLVVRMPDWWSAKNRPRPRVSVSVGGKAPSTLGMEALLDFDVKLTLDGKALSPQEIETLLASSDGLVLIKGKWVEVDRDKLGEVLDQWRDVQKQAQTGGVSFGEAMRMLAGARARWRRDGRRRRRPAGVVGGHRRQVALLQARRAALARVAGRDRRQRRPAGRASPLPEARGAVALDPARPGARRLPGRRHGPGQDHPGAGGSLPEPAQQGEGHRPAGGAGLARRQLAPGDRALRARAEGAHRPSVAHPLDRTEEAVEKESGGARCGDHHLRHRHADRLDERASLAERDPRRGPGHQEPGRQADQGGQGAGIEVAPGPDRHAGGEPARRPVVDLRLPEPGASRLGQGVQRLLQVHGVGQARRLRAAAQAGAAVHPATAQDRQERHRRPARQDRGQRLLPAEQAPGRPVPAVGRRDEEGHRGGFRGIERRGVVLAFLMRFKQICNHPSQWLGDGSYEAADSGKLARLRELGESIAARQDKVLVFTQFREMTEPLAGFLAEVFGRTGLVLHGGTPVKKRQGLVESFQSDDRVPFMVLSLKAGGTGLNLTAASHVIHFDRWWNPAVENQATDRAFRIGQKKNVLVHKFVCRGTVEERIDELIAGKQKLSDEILSGGAESALTEMSNEELISMVSLDLSSALEG